MFRMRNLNGWQRLWAVFAGATLVYALAWGFSEASTYGGERVNEKVIAGFANPVCRSILEMSYLDMIVEGALSTAPPVRPPMGEIQKKKIAETKSALSADFSAENLDAYLASLKDPLPSHPNLEIGVLEADNEIANKKSSCSELLSYRSHYHENYGNAPTTANDYVKDIEARRREYFLSTLGIAMGIWLVGVVLLYAVGLLVAWVRRGFAPSREHP